MSKEELTPCGVLFDMMKRYGGISNKKLAAMMLSGKPLSDGVSPVSRINDRAWLSRFVVHAPVGSIQERYFADFSSSALRVVARLRSGKRKRLSNAEIMNLVAGEPGDEMREALLACHQHISLYDNVIERLVHESGYTEGERTEMAMVLLVAAGCTANVRKATEAVISFSQMAHGVGMATPLVTPDSVQKREGIEDSLSELEPYLMLFRVEDGYLKGEPHWLNPDESEIVEIGSLALGPHSITDVDVDVSGNHLKLVYEQGQWYVQGSNSKFGTVLIDGATHEEVVVEPAREEREDGFGFPKVPINPGDELLLGSSTRFVIMAGRP